MVCIVIISIQLSQSVITHILLYDNHIIISYMHKISNVVLYDPSDVESSISILVASLSQNRSQ